MVNDPVDMEALAAQEHESWSKWTRWMLGQIEKETKEWQRDYRAHPGREPDIATVIRSLPCVERWKRQMNTLYVDLPKTEKESDRKVVREKLPLYRPDTVAMRGGVSRRG